MKISGWVNARREATVQMRIRGSGGAEQDVTALVDTGFTGALMLPTTVVAFLALPLVSARKTVLGDGTVRQLDLHGAEVGWGGQWRQVLVHAAGREPLVGSRLLEGHQLRIDVTPGGTVEITPLP